MSSQFFTGLLFALPLAEEDSVLQSTTPLESKSYVDMTVDTLSRHGITIYDRGEGRYDIPGGQHYQKAPSPWKETTPRLPSGLPPPFPAAP